MKIVVCVKEVPDTTEVKIDPETGTLIRSGVPAILNPFDMYALEAALEVKDENSGTEVIVLSMGPPQAEKNLRDTIAMGVDDVYLIRIGHSRERIHGQHLIRFRRQSNISAI